MAGQVPQTGWLLTRTESLGNGRSRLTFLVNGETRRIAEVWGDPPDEGAVVRFGERFVIEQRMRPVGARYQSDVSNEPGPVPAELGADIDDDPPRWVP